jgi:hypothetical protein
MVVMAKPQKSAETGEVELRPDGWERFEKAVDAATRVPAQHRAMPTPKAKARPASKGVFIRASGEPDRGYIECRNRRRLIATGSANAIMALPNSPNLAPFCGKSLIVFSKKLCPKGVKRCCRQFS